MLNRLRVWWARYQENQLRLAALAEVRAARADGRITAGRDHHMFLGQTSMIWSGAPGMVSPIAEWCYRPTEIRSGQGPGRYARLKTWLHTPLW
jgi:hypothetical protein